MLYFFVSRDLEGHYECPMTLDADQRDRILQDRKVREHEVLGIGHVVQSDFRDSSDLFEHLIGLEQSLLGDTPEDSRLLGLIGTVAARVVNELIASGKLVRRSKAISRE